MHCLVHRIQIQHPTPPSQCSAAPQVKTNLIWNSKLVVALY
mgnify:CR=1 FL=1